MQLRMMVAAAAALIALAAAPRAIAVQVQDMVRIKGAESSKLVGVGLVVGLNGTGDGNKARGTIRRLTQLLANFDDPLATEVELADAKNVAVVYLSATIPAGGVREGQKIDVNVAAPIASSLQGGRLVMCPMTGPIRNSGIYAFAEGPIAVEDPANARNGKITAGATLTENVFAQYIDEYGRMTLVINAPNATWPMSHTMATLVNDLMAPDSAPIAFAIDQTNVIVQVPSGERAAPGSFIRQILEIQFDPSLVRTEARVVINEKTGTIVMTENVEISPVVISHKGLTITTITPQPEPTAEQPRIEDQQFFALDPARRSGARLGDLLTAFNQLKVPAEDRIHILKQIWKSGKLHAQLIVED